MKLFDRQIDNKQNKIDRSIDREIDRKKEEDKQKDKFPSILTIPSFYICEKK